MQTVALIDFPKLFSGPTAWLSFRTNFRTRGLTIAKGIDFSALISTHLDFVEKKIPNAKTETINPRMKG